MHLVNICYVGTILEREARCERRGGTQIVETICNTLRVRNGQMIFGDMVIIDTDGEVFHQVFWCDHDAYTILLGVGRLQIRIASDLRLDLAGFYHAGFVRQVHIRITGERRTKQIENGRGYETLIVAPTDKNLVVKRLP